MNALAKHLYNAVPDDMKTLSNDGLHVVYYPYHEHYHQQVLENTGAAKLKWLFSYLVDEQLIDSKQ